MAEPQMIPAWVDGTLTPVEKLEVHQKGLRHKAVSVFVMDGMEILLQRRALSKYHTPGLWANTCCTHPMWNEDAADCAVRRLDDELGITGLFPAHRDRVEYRAEVGGGLIEHEVADIFIAPATKALKMNLNPDEVMETRWVDLFELRAEIERRPERFTPWIRIYLAQHSEKIFGALMKA
ncbi:MAG: isopentenyl-diphosphate Delta-isomerase [Pseudomonadota bacterium]